MISMKFIIFSYLNFISIMETFSLLFYVEENEVVIRKLHNRLFHISFNPSGILTLCFP